MTECPRSAAAGGRHAHVVTSLEGAASPPGRSSGAAQGPGANQLPTPRVPPGSRRPDGVQSHRQVRGPMTTRPGEGQSGAPGLLLGPGRRRHSPGARPVRARPQVVIRSLPAGADRPPNLSRSRCGGPARGGRAQLPGRGPFSCKRAGGPGAVLCGRFMKSLQ